MALASRRDAWLAASGPRAPGTWRRVSPGTRGKARRPLHGRRAGPCAADQARGDRAARRHDRQGPVPTVVAGLRRPRDPGHRRALHPSCSPTRPSSPATATIGLEILEDLPDVDAVARPVRRRRTVLRDRVGRARDSAAGARLACEVETAAPFAASLAAGRPTAVEYTPSFVDGIGGEASCPRCGRSPRAFSPDRSSSRSKRSPRRSGFSPNATASSPRAPAGASVAAAASRQAPAGKLVCVVSGGNIDAAVLASILAGAMP